MYFLFLTSSYVHSLIYVGYNAEKDKNIKKIWGEKQTTVVSAETSQSFFHELLSSDSATLKSKYDHTHLLVLNDVSWIDYEQVLSRTLFLYAQPKLMLCIPSLYDGNLLTITNLARSNDRLPLLFDAVCLKEATRGYIYFKSGKNNRIYTSTVFNPFDPYPANINISTEFTTFLYSIKSTWSTIAQSLNFKGSLLLSCNTDNKKQEIIRFIKSKGFKLISACTYQQNNTTVYVSSSIEFKRFKVDELHIIEPVDSLAQTLSQAKNPNVITYLYVPYVGPFEESIELHYYRKNLGSYLEEARYIESDEDVQNVALTDILKGLFLHNAIWYRPVLLSTVQCISNKFERMAILEELESIIKNKIIVTDLFGTRGHVVFSENSYIFQPNITDL